MSDLAASLAAFAPRGSSVAVVAEEQPKVQTAPHLPLTRGYLAAQIPA